MVNARNFSPPKEGDENATIYGTHEKTSSIGFMAIIFCHCLKALWPSGYGDRFEFQFLSVSLWERRFKSCWCRFACC